jgi:hypothetical protein
MKKVVFILVLSLGFAWNCHAQSWTYLQDSIATSCSGSTCTIGNWNMLPTTAGSVIIITVGTTNNNRISSASGGGGTWTLCPANAHVFRSGAPFARMLDCIYSFNVAGGTTSLSVTLSGSAGTVFGANVIEIAPPPGSTASLDTSNSIIDGPCSGPCPAVSLNLSATDMVLQVLDGNAPGLWNGYSSPYITDNNSDGIGLNLSGTTSPTITVRSPANGAVLFALAFKSSAGTFTPPTQPISVVNYTNPTGLNCSPTCTLTGVPNIAAGHLLYIEAGNLTTGVSISSISGGGAWVVPAGANSCRISESSPTSEALSCAYVLSSTATSNPPVVTMTGSASTSFAVWELATTGTGFTFDKMGSATNSPSLTPAGVSLSPLNGSNDVIFQSAGVPGGTSAVSLYAMPLNTGSGQGINFVLNNQANAGLLNTTNGSAPHWANEQNNQTIVTGIAFSAGTGTGTAPAPPTNLKAVVN